MRAVVSVRATPGHPSASPSFHIPYPVSGERLGVLVDKVPKAAEEKEMSWDSIDKTLTYYAERFKARMQAAK